MSRLPFDHAPLTSDNPPIERDFRAGAPARIERGS